MRLPLAALCFALSFAPAAAQTVEDGFEAYDAGDYATAKTILLPLAEAGDARAMNRIGYMYDFGKGFPKDPTAACDWYEKAAELGYARAQSNLSICFRENSGRTENKKLAIVWAERAAEQGHLGSQIALINLYKDCDPEKSRYWGQKTADARNIIGRERMDALGIPFVGPRVSRGEKYCFIIMVNLLGKSDTYCDGVNFLSVVPGRPPDP